MNEIKIFDNAEFGQIRTVTVGEKNFFVASDVAKALGYVNDRDAISRHCRWVVKHDIPHPQSKDKTIEVNVISEGDIYRLVAHSQLPAAEKFESWVFDEIIPTIRQTGGYINNSDKFVDMYFDEMPEEQKNVMRGLLNSIEEKQKKIKTLQSENSLLAQKNLEWADRPLINALVRAYGHSIGGDYQTAWRDFKKELLYRHSINLNARKTAHLNNGGKKMKTLDFIHNDELQQAISTAVSLCKDNDVDISEIIEKKAS